MSLTRIKQSLKIKMLDRKLSSFCFAQSLLWTHSNYTLTYSFQIVLMYFIEMLGIIKYSTIQWCSHKHKYENMKKK